ncbi:MAG: branched-chain amino acid ABC transporter substrate-binding protein [Proteobacteria bacterium]|nr:branched-chain amino acid ABC transporter substrate-binding protein [Pseudomonadota bacterium]
MKTYSKTFASMVFIAILALSLFACSKTEQEDVKDVATQKTDTPEIKTDVKPDMAQGDTIKLGVAGAHSGELASYGLPTVNAVTIVVDNINKHGGILGKQIELFVEDDVCKPEVATNTATKLVTDKVVAVIGHICSGATKAALNIYKDANLICMSPSATNTDLTLSGEYPNFFRTISHDAAQAKLQVDFALSKLHVKKVAILHDKGDYGKGSATLAKQFFEESGKVEIVLFEGVTPGAVDYSAIVQKVKYNGADLVVWGGYHPEASRIVKQMRVKKMDTLMIGSDGLKDESFINTAGEYAEGVYVSGPLDTSKNPLYINAIEEHKAKYGEEPGAFYFNAYAATLALTNAIEKSGSTDYAAVSHALKTEYVDTPIGKISFDEHGDAIGAGFTMYQVTNGAFKEVE